VGVAVPSAGRAGFITALLLSTFILAAPAAMGQSRTLSVASGSAEGHVICDDGSPARLAQVYLKPLARYFLKGQQWHGTPSSAPSYTDFDGYFRLADVSPGTYVVDIQKDGYSRELPLILSNSEDFSPARLRELLSGYPQVTVMAGGTSRVDAVIHRGATISGRISFDTGGVMGSAPEVTAKLISSASMDDPKISFEDNTKSDDRGIYRFAGLPAGKYRISVRVFIGNPNVKLRSSADLRVFAPDTVIEADASVVKIDEGDEVSNVDILIPIGKMHTISGVVLKHGAPVPSVAVSIHSLKEKFDPHLWHGGFITSANGSFRFDLLLPGDYQLEATTDDRQNKTDGTIKVTLGDSDVSDVAIDLSSPAATKEH
jgi:hypothetical protein